MKFQQRLVISASVSIVVVFWLIFSLDVIGLGWRNGEKEHRISYRSLSLSGINFNSNIRNSNLETCSPLENIKPVSNISTLDIKAKSNYIVLSSGDYELPTLKPGNEYGPEIEHLNVIIIPHSHNDPGWLRTLEEYYVYTTKNILNNMVEKLRLYPNMTFIWAETVFLSMWWNELEDDMKLQVRRLVRRGQLEIVLGGWVMPDEASTHYYSVIDQLMEGHQWLIENLHVKPVNSWSIDPFGHSGTMPYLWKKAGLENMVIQRIHQANKGVLAENGNLEFMWRQFWDPSGKWDIPCHVMPYMLYSIKHTCGPHQYVCVMFDYRHIPSDFVRPLALPITPSNIETQAKYLYEEYRRKASLYKYNTILVPLGDDFRYDHHQEWDQQYVNYDKLINYMNSKKEWKIHLKFGTLKEYFGLLKRREKSKSKINSSFKFQSLSGDFFPYSDKDNAYWTGYYTTRPFDKRTSREIEANLRAADILNTLLYIYSKKWQQNYKHYHEVTSSLQNARRTLGLFLHHDAITGTSKSFVVEDLEQKLLHSYNATQHVIRLAIQSLLSKGKLAVPAIFKPEITRKSSQTLALKQIVTVLEGGTKVVVFNPLPRRRSELISVIVDSDNIAIRNSKNESIMYQLNPKWSSATVVMEELFEVVFLTNLDPFELQTFTLYRIKDKPKNIYPAKITIYGTEELAVAPALKFILERPRHSGNFEGSIVIENEFIRAEFNSEKGTLQTVYDKLTSNITKIDLEFMNYRAKGSGAYLFQPFGKAEPIAENPPIIHVIEGPLMSYVEVIYPFLHHSVKLFNNPAVQGRGLHIQNVLNLNTRSGVWKNLEVIMRMRTSVQNKNMNYFTDQNGYQLIERHTTETWPIEANYYPISTMAVLEDSKKRLTLHAGQPHGVASLQEGWLEVMLDRQLIYDDERGLSEGVEDNKATVSKFVLQLEYKNKISHPLDKKFTFPSLLSHSFNELLQNPIQKIFSQINTEILDMDFKPTDLALPCDLSLVSLKNLANSDLVYNGTSLILHRYGYKCGFPTEGLQCEMNTRMSVQLFLREAKMTSVRETTLTHMYDKTEISPDKDLLVPPMELKTYKISLS